MEQLQDYSTRKFMIFNVSELSNIDFTQVLETTADTIRSSVDGTLTFVKWDSETIPASVDALTTKEGPYTYDEIITILASTEWVDNSNMPQIEIISPTDELIDNKKSRKNPTTIIEEPIIPEIQIPIIEEPIIPETPTILPDDEFIDEPNTPE